MKNTVAVVLVVIALAGCTNTDHVNPTAQPSGLVPTFDAAQNWDGNNSPVLDWSQSQRDAFTAQYADASSAALSKAGLPAQPLEDATAVDAFRRADALGAVVPRPAREIALLDTTESRTENALSPTAEAAALDAAWTTCLKLGDGKTYGDLVFEASMRFDESERSATDTARLAGVLYAPVVCYESARATLDDIAGIDGPEILD